MDLKRLPYLPPHFFYYSFTPVQRRLFLGLMTLLLLAAGAWLYSYQSPAHWALEVSPVPETYAEVLPVDTIEHAYRHFPLSFRVYRQQVGYSASQLRPQAPPFQLAFGLLLLGWTLVLGVASQITLRWSFLFYLLFGFFLHSTGIAAQLIPDPWWGRVLEFGLLVTFLGLAYLFQSDTLRVPLGGRLLIFGSMLGALFGLAYQQDGWLALHQMGGEAFIYLTVLSLAFVLYVATTPTSLIIYGATNQPQPTRRLSPGWILGIYGLWALINFLWLDEFLGWNITGITLGIRPAYVLMGSSLLTVFLSQNHFHQVREAFIGVFPFTMLLGSWALITLSTWFMFTASFDPVYVYAIERLAAVAFAAVGMGHMLFVFSNHGFLLRNKVNGYYLMANGPRFPFPVVWLMGLILLVVAEGVESWKSLRLLPHSYAVQLADQYLLRGNHTDARLHYEIALQATQYSPKANHNLASLLLEEPGQLPRAVVHYRQAGAGFDFPYGNLNAATLLVLNNQATAAETVLHEGVERSPQNPMLWTSLGNLYLKQQQPDSAIAAYQRALQADLNLGPVYSNLAQLYWQYQRPEDAKAFFMAGLTTPDPGVSTLLSAIWYQLVSGDSLPLPRPEQYGYQDPLLSYNEQLLDVEARPSASNRAQIKALADQESGSDALMLDAYLMLRDDSVAYAMSRMQFLTSQYPAYASVGNYLLGVGFYERDLPELARTYFEQAYQAGDPRGGLYAAKMTIDLGGLAAGHDSLSRLRARHDVLWEECSREISLLLSAVGQPLYARTEWDPNTLTFDERVRLGRYADSMAYGSIALRTYQDLVSEDTNTVVPYLELGKIYNHYGDSLALVNLALGLAKAPDHQALRLEYAEAWLHAGRPDRAAAQLDSLPPSTHSQPQWQRLAARLALAQGDTAAAIQQLDSLVQTNLYDRRSILQLAAIYHQRGQVSEGFTLLEQALTHNDQHPLLWAEYAFFTYAAGDQAASTFAQAQALALAFTPAQRDQIEAAFEAWPRNASPEVRPDLDEWEQ
jgi:predicted Zn-dependent protease